MCTQEVQRYQYLTTMFTTVFIQMKKSPFKEKRNANKINFEQQQRSLTLTIPVTISTEARLTVTRKTVPPVVGYAVGVLVTGVVPTRLRSRQNCGKNHLH